MDFKINSNTLKKETNKILFLNNYSKEIASRITQNNRHIIINSVSNLNLLIEEALNTNDNKALHLGIIDIKIVQKIKKKIVNLPKDRDNYLENANYDLVISQSEIRHIKSNKTRLTKKEIYNYVKNILNIIIEFDNISYTKQKEEALRFKKKINNVVYYIIVIVSNKKHTLTIKTIYIDKFDYEAKKETYLHRLIVK